MMLSLLRMAAFAMPLAFPANPAIRSFDARTSMVSAYADGKLYTLDVKTLGGQDEMSNADVLESNVLFESQNCTPEGHPFVPVVDSVRGRSRHPIWQGLRVVFDNLNFPCTQFTSAGEIGDAADAGLISLEPTGEIYRCAPIGQKRR